MAPLAPLEHLPLSAATGGMMPSIRRALRASVILSTAFTLVWSQAATAVTWGTVAVISDSGHAYGSYHSTAAVTGTETVHVVFSEDDPTDPVVMYRRSIDGGTTWDPAVEISRPEASLAYAGAFRASGTTLDLVTFESNGSGEWRLWYRRSINEGVDWSDPMRLTPLDGNAGAPDVARSGDRVTVAYTDGNSGKIYVRVSTDGGDTFGAKQLIASTTNQPFQGDDSYDGFVQAVDAAGTINVAWDSSARRIMTRRSRNGGSSWGTARTLATNAYGSIITAVASNAKVIVGYTSAVDGFWRATARRSIDEGHTWKGAQLIGGRRSFDPIFAIRDGVYRVTFEHCTTTDCSSVETLFSTATNGGGPWQTPVRVSRKADTPAAFPVGIGALDDGRSVVVYGHVDGSGDAFIYSRTTQ